MCGFGGNESRYLYAGQDMPNLYGFAMEHLSFDFQNPKLEQKDMEIDEPKNVNHQFLQELIQK